MWYTTDQTFTIFILQLNKFGLCLGTRVLSKVSLLSSCANTDQIKSFWKNILSHSKSKYKGVVTSLSCPSGGMKNESACHGQTEAL